MKIGSRYLARSVALLVLAALSSCSKLSHVGDQTEPAPHAIAVTIGEAYTTDSSGNLQTTVRAGSDVVLSGKESEKGDNDTGVPLVNFKWEQLTPGSNAVQLIARTSNTVSFTAPQVTVATTLNFKLTVSDVKGNAASTEAHITVQPVRDQDHFVQYLNVSNTIPVVMATRAPIVADSTASATATLPVVITITKLVTFPDRNDSTVTHTRVAVGTPVSISTGWNTKLGSSISCTGNQNPIIQVPVPRLNLDDLLPAGAFPDAVVLSDLLEPSDVDQATLEVRIDIASTSGVVTSAIPVACVNGAASASASAAVFATEALLATATPRDPKAAAQAYYTTIDPTASKNTFNKWLDANGFTSSVSGWNADAHAVYTNNFDLGFGRDMYMKIGGATGKCDDGTPALPITQAHINSGKCDVAAVVVNYSGVEAAAKKLNPVIAVAMEYSAPASGGARIVKFYTFAPDTRTGDYKRVLSVNLDRRGEQYLPQACVVCHGGTPGAVDGSGKYNGIGDVKAGFLPWDLDSLLYSDTDPGFSTKSRDASLRAQYTRSMQEAQLKTLNLGAYLTFADPAGATGRYAVMRELLEGWYHGSSTTGLTATTFDGSFVPQGWKPAGIDAVASTADDNPADSATLYTDVFARNCRMCHSLQVPVSGDPRTATVSISSANIAACSNDVRLANSRVGTAFQVPIGCYWEFAHAPNLADRLSRNQMPFARRTSDRMWVNGSSAQTAGAELQAHLLRTQNLTVATPGTASVGIAISPTSADIGDVVTLDGSSSRFGDLLAWTVDACTGTPAAPGTCSRAMPVVGSNGVQARFIVDSVVTYRVTQMLNGGAANGASYFQVQNKTPVLSAVTTSTQIGTPITLPNVVTTLGNGSLTQHTITLTVPTGLSAVPSCSVAAPCSANTVVTLTPTVTNPTPVSSPLVVGVSVMDAGGDATPVTTTVSIAVTSTIAAQNLGSLPSSTLHVNANATGDAAFNLLNEVKLATPSYASRTDLSVAGVTYTGSRSPLTRSFSANVLTYRPANGFATHDLGGNAQNPPYETFSYYLERRDTNGNVVEVSNTAIATIKVQARVTFTTMRNTWANAPCSSCHNSSMTNGAPDLSALSYAGFINGFLKSPNTSKAYVNLATPAQSGLVCWPKSNCTLASGSHFDGIESDSAVQNILLWIQDGANNF
jgi:hypothetical protein